MGRATEHRKVACLESRDCAAIEGILRRIDRLRPPPAPA